MDRLQQKRVEGDVLGGIELLVALELPALPVLADVRQRAAGDDVVLPDEALEIDFVQFLLAVFR